jgi:uncharacterized repeat protein (TIGR01451 family)
MVVKLTAVRRMLAAGVAAAAVGAWFPTTASAQAVQTAPAASADAYGLDVDVKLLSGNVPINVGPEARATQDFPPAATAPAEDEVLGVGQVPAGTGQLVQNIGVISSIASATGAPQAVASSQAVDVRLINQAGVPLITADLVRAQSNTDCVNDPNATGTEFVNLRVAGQTDPISNPAPNTEIAAPLFNPLGLRVIVNEQHPTADGRGLVVNAIHIYNVEPAPASALFDGDIIVSHAMTTVNCPNGRGSTGNSNPVFIVKEADKTSARPGENVTYTTTVRNTAAAACVVNQFIEHMPQAFEFVSTSGAFGEAVTQVTRPGGGVDVILKPANVSIATGATATQTFVLKVRDDAVEGVYFNNVEILCANLGNYVKGLDAPVRVTRTAPPTPRKPQCSDLIDNDGDGKVDFGPDPGCDSPQDDDERDAPRPLPRTGGGSTAVALGLLLAGFALALRRRAVSL